MSNNIVFADEKKGYNKEQVNRYIEELTRRYEAALTAKDRELAQVKSNLEETKKQWDVINGEYQTMKGDKDRIATILIDSQVRAEQIVADARREAEEEKQSLIKESDDKRDLLVARNKMLRDMRLDVAGLFDEFKQNIEASYQNIIQTIDGNLEKFTEATQQISDKYPKDGDTHPEANDTEVENVEVKSEEGSL